MSDIIARLRYLIDSTQAANAKKDLDAMAVSAKKAEAGAGDLAAKATAAASPIKAIGGAAVEATAGIETMGAAAGVAAPLLLGLLGTAVTAVALRRIAEVGDQYAIVSNRVRDMADAGQDVAAFQKQLTDLAIETHQPIDKIVASYQTLSADAENVNKTAAELLNLTAQQARASDHLQHTMSGGWQTFTTGLDTAIGKLDKMLGLSEKIGAVFEYIGRFLGGTTATNDRPGGFGTGVLPLVSVYGDAPSRGRTPGTPRAARAPATRRSNDFSRTSNFEKSLAALADGVGNITGGKGGSSLSAAFDGKTEFAGVIDSARAAGAQAQALVQSLADGMQRTLADGFAGLLTNGLSSVADFARGLRDTLINAFSQVLASRAAAALFGGSGTGLSSLASGGGILGALGMGGGASKLSNIGKGASGFNFGAGALVGLGGLTIGSAIGQSAGTGAGVLGGAATGAALGTIVPGIGNVAGAIIGGLAGAIGGLFGGSARKKAREAEQRAINEAKAAYAAEQASESGSYLAGAPAGFSLEAYRFNAGRPASSVFTGDITIAVPEGTTADQARRLLSAFDDLTRAQGLPAGALPRAR